MKIIVEWRKLLRYAWSVRLALIAGMLSGASTVLPYFEEYIPRGVFAGLSFCFIVAATLAQFVEQENMK